MKDQIEMQLCFLGLFNLFEHFDKEKDENTRAGLLKQIESSKEFLFEKYGNGPILRNNIEALEIVMTYNREFFSKQSLEYIEQFFKSFEIDDISSFVKKH